MGFVQKRVDTHGVDPNVSGFNNDDGHGTDSVAACVRTGRPFARQVLAADHRFVARLQKQSCPVPADVAEAVATLLDGLKTPGMALTDFVRSVYPRVNAARRTADVTASMEAASTIASSVQPPRPRIMSGPSALAFDDGALTSLARRRALFPVLQAIDVNIPRLNRVLFRLPDRVLLLKERRAHIYEIQAIAGRRFLRRVEAACQEFEDRLAQQGHEVPDDVYYAVCALFMALEVPVNRLTDRFEGGPTDEAACANDRTQARYAAERHRRKRYAAIHRRIATGAATGAIQQRFMPIVRRTVYREIVHCLKSYEGPALEFEGRRIVNMIDSEVAAPASADVLTAAFVQTLFPLWGVTTTPEVVRKSRSRHRPSSR